MSVFYDFLSRDSGPEVCRTFFEAFSDYAIDMTYMDEESVLNRAIKNGVDFECSVGIFDGGKMVGFTLVGLDQWQGIPCAFDAGTGIIKAYRGKGHAQGMFDFVCPRLRAMGIRKFVLEVLQENLPAVKAYQKSGFRIERHFDCFQLEVKNARGKNIPDIPCRVEPIDRKDLESYTGFLDWTPSWENSLSAVRRIPDEVWLFGGFLRGRPVGICVYYPALTWIMCLAVDGSFRRRGIASHMLLHVIEKLRANGTELIKVVNVPPEEEGMQELLRRWGFRVYTTQYEMHLQF